MLKIQKLNNLNKWYHHSRLAIMNLEDRVQEHIKIGNEQKEFLDMTSSEVKKYFEKLQYELEIAYIFKIISATEGILRQDFDKRIHLRKPKKEPDKTFKDKNIRGTARLKEDILDIWKKKVFKKNKFIISQFYDLLNYRHWIAHGQYWIYEQQIFNIASAMVITTGLLNECVKLKSDFNQQEM